MKNIILTAIVVMLSFFKVSAQEVSEKYLLSPAVFESQIENKKQQLIDVRTAEEYQKGTIQGAKNIDFLKDTFETSIQQLDKTKPVYIFCQSGKRSARAYQKMKEMGFQQLFELDGGYKAWTTPKN